MIPVLIRKDWMPVLAALAEIRIAVSLYRISCMIWMTILIMGKVQLRIPNLVATTNPVQAAMTAIPARVTEGLEKAHPN